MKLARLTKPILQLFSSGSSPGPGARTSFVTKIKKNIDTMEHGCTQGLRGVRGCGGLRGEGDKSGPLPPKFFSRLVNKNATKPLKGVPSPGNFHSLNYRLTYHIKIM
jgi:hypothetical protein